MNQDDFCGTTIGHLEVVGWDGKSPNGCKIYHVRCRLCATDPELNGLSVYPTTKARLTSGFLPCACSKNYRWNDSQQTLRSNRIGVGKYTSIVVDGIANCVCHQGHRWSVDATRMINNKTGCPECNRLRKIVRFRLDEQTAIERVRAQCEAHQYNYLGHDGWIGGLTRLSMSCDLGHSWSPTYDNFMHAKTSCPGCSKSGYDPTSPGWFYLYVWELGGHKFIKYGITSNPRRRLYQQSQSTEYAPTQVVCIQFADGSVPPAIERHLSNFPPAISKELFPDGWTETIDIEHYPYITRLITAINDPRFVLSDLPSIS